MFLIWKCFTYFRPRHLNPNQSVDDLCSFARDQILHDICDNRIVKITLEVIEAAKLQFIFEISSRSVFPSAEKIWLIESSSQTDQHWQLELLEVVIKAVSGVAES